MYTLSHNLLAIYSPNSLFAALKNALHWVGVNAIYIAPIAALLTASMYTQASIEQNGWNGWYAKITNFLLISGLLIATACFVWWGFVKPH